MNLEIVPSDKFKKSFKSLYKKYHSLKADYEEFEKQLRENPKLGADLGGGYRKIRLSIHSKNKGKSGGARIISYELCLKEIEGTVILVDIYDKSELDSMEENDYTKIMKTFLKKL